MKEKKPQKQLFRFVILSLLSVVSVVVMANESFAALNCSNCHGNNLGTDARPLDTPPGSLSSYRNITTGAVKGSHSKHLPATMTPSDCSVCHNTTNTTSSHRDGRIEFTAGLAYNKGAGNITFTNQTSVPVMGSCATASCHVAATDLVKATPSWGNTSDCNSCHDATPTTGAHTKHLTSSYHLPVCGDCHTGATTTNGGANHMNSTVSVAAGLGYPAETVKHASGSYVGSCSTSYCHSSGQSLNGTSAVPVYSTPSWGAPASGACGTCHATTGNTTGRHPTHLVKDTNCGNCHTGATATTYAATTHVDGNIDVTAALGYTAAGAPGNGYGTCSAATCHNPFTNGTPKVTRAWGTTGTSCTACHNNPQLTGAHNTHNNLAAVAAVGCDYCHTSNADPKHANGFVDVTFMAAPVAKHNSTVYTATCTTTCHSPYTGAVTTPTWGAIATCTSCHVANTGAHTKHITAPVIVALGTTCGTCHTGYTDTAADPTNHANGNIDVAQYSPTSIAKHAAGAYSATCTTACHNPLSASVGIATPTWGATATCASCHNGADAFTGSGAPATGFHTEHLTHTSLPATPITCANCHTGASLISGGAAHINGTIDVIGYAVQNKTKGSAASTCTASCHNGPGATPAFIAPAVTWGVPLTCNGCHGFPPPDASHATGVTSSPQNCSSCHDEVAVGATDASNTTFAKPLLHMNGVIDGGGCNSCHGYPPVPTMVGLVNYSGAKLQNYSGGGGVHAVAGHLSPSIRPSAAFGTLGQTATGCITCHPSTLHNQGAGTFLTANVQIQVDGQYRFDKNRPIVYSAKQSGTSKTSGTCSNVACHFQKSPIWSTQTYTQGH